ncbi:MAG TPA: 50S ribosomal protein L29 [Dehalococcoidia bacterium]|nr:50S ribosomal protein L29 [Dehalococcoidia bacterium]
MSSTTDELRVLEVDALLAELESAHRELFNLRFQISTNQLGDISEIKKARRQIARIKTLIREDEIKKEKSEG